MSSAKESLLRAIREREAAERRGDQATVELLDRAIDELWLAVDDDQDGIPQR